MPLNVKIELSPKQVEEAVKFYLKSQGYETTSVSIQCFMASTDYFDRGPGSPALSKIVADVQPVNQKISYGSLASQIEDIESRGTQR